MIDVDEAGEVKYGKKTVQRCLPVVADYTDRAIYNCVTRGCAHGPINRAFYL